MLGCASRSSSAAALRSGLLLGSLAAPRDGRGVRGARSACGVASSEGRQEGMAWVQARGRVVHASRRSEAHQLGGGTVQRGAARCGAVRR
eukprot:6500407-Prymnesium_polylepis.2